MVKMFWGITLENGKRYSQTVDVGFHVSMAALEVSPTGAHQRKVVSVMLEHEKTEFLLCSLQHDECRQQTLDLNFIEGEEITFFINGPGTVHLTGYVLETNDESEGEELPDEIPETSRVKRKLKDDGDKKLKRGKFELKSFEDDDDSEEVLENWSEDDDDDNSDISEYEEESDDEPEPAAKKKNNSQKVEKIQPTSPQKKAKNNKNRNKFKTDKVAPSETKPRQAKTESVEENGEEKLSARAKKKKKKKKRLSESSAQNDSQTNTTLPQTGQAKSSNLVRKIGGVTVVDSTVGNGPVAKKGRSVRIHYVGKLINNKVFDSSKKDLFSFQLGSSEVINGMNIGIEGMRVGGKRTITIPPNQGYGKQSAGDIPPNSTLIFEIQLKAVN